MKFHRQIIAILFLIVALSSITSGQIKTISGNTLSEAELEDFLKQKMDSLEIPGLSIAIINDEKIVYQKLIGYSNIKTKQAVTENTVFEMASLTKPVFAYFVFKMLEQQKIDLDTQLYTYLSNPELDHDERYKLITARNVLNHTTGLPNWRYMTNKMSYLELLNTPGEVFTYSGEGYEYLANAIIRQFGGTQWDLEALFQKEILGPLNMQNSSFIWDENMGIDKAHGHVLPDLPNNRSPFKLARVAGGLHSNAVDYAKFLIGIMQETGLTSSSVQKMLAPSVELPEDNAIRTTFGVEWWTLGFAYEETPYGVKHSHGGNNVDFQSYFEFYKEKGIGYVFVTNCSKGNDLNVELNKLLSLGKVVRNF